MPLSHRPPSQPPAATTPIPVSMDLRVPDTSGKQGHARWPPCLASVTQHRASVSWCVSGLPSLFRAE